MRGTAANSMDSERIPGRSIRVDDDLWQQAQEACAWRGDGSLSAVIRRQLKAYVRATNSKRAQFDQPSKGNSNGRGANQA